MHPRVKGGGFLFPGFTEMAHFRYIFKGGGFLFPEITEMARFSNVFK